MLIHVMSCSNNRQCPITIRADPGSICWWPVIGPAPEVPLPIHSAGLRRPVPCTADTSETTADQDLLYSEVLIVNDCCRQVPCNSMGPYSEAMAWQPSMGGGLAWSW